MKLYGESTYIISTYSKDPKEYQETFRNFAKALKDYIIAKFTEELRGHVTRQGYLLGQTFGTVRRLVMFVRSESVS